MLHHQRDASSRRWICTIIGSEINILGNHSATVAAEIMMVV
jgi:hypothetical protein